MCGRFKVVSAADSERSTFTGSVFVVLNRNLCVAVVSEMRLKHLAPLVCILLYPVTGLGIKNDRNSPNDVKLCGLDFIHVTYEVRHRKVNI